MVATQQIAMTALITALVTGILTEAMILLRRRASGGGIGVRLSAIIGDLLAVALATGIGVALWRLGANTPTLNNDPIPGVSPADVLSAPVAYVSADIYLRLRGAGASEQLGVGPAVAALVALIVNIITI